MQTPERGALERSLTWTSLHELQEHILHRKRRPQVPGGGRPPPEEGHGQQAEQAPTLGRTRPGFEENDGTEPPGKREKPAHKPDGGKH